ncbi:family 43 glycosylhydrolase [Demequina capsici]|uniref:Family 43 glycosylhydrolase n=1 Tax=Demequina capsici TaxID=3075620 RepID=A0AA96FF72_9MICO|nr:family 43 glycosylhydrolase [Demequina sp. PMTSA13]WNM28525.1 family 43 glycosylhydrolase [Demequina sp. PMTSA13]
MPTPIHNPIVLQRADPCVLRHAGEYYLTGSHPAYDRIVLRRAATLDGLQAADEVTVWRRPDSGPQSHLIWAPELHRVNQAWYLYYAAAPDEEVTSDDGEADPTFNHRVYCLECRDEDPLTGTWVDRGQVDTGWESFALDATSVVLDGVQHLVWAQQDLAIKGHSNIYIARMRNPWTLATPAVLLTRPEHDWETVTFWVNEGPSVLVKNGKVSLTYSASGTGTEYAMGLLTADADADLLDPASWTKSPDPVLASDASVGIYGPGHNSFTETPEGETVLVYHARTYTRLDGDPLWEPNRHACAQVLPFDADGRPVWGRPAALTRPVPATAALLSPEGTMV